MWLTISIVANVILLLTVIGLVLVYRKKVKELESVVRELERELQEFKDGKRKKKSKTSFKEKLSTVVDVVKTGIAVAAVMSKMKK